MDLFMQDSPSDASSETVHSTSLFAVTPNEQAGQSPPSQSAPSEPAQPRKRGRKGHSKSRTGCFNCKRARIKCKENRPECDYCAHRGLKCEWPDLQINQVGTMIRRPSPVPAVVAPALQFAIQSPAPVFTMQDFRLFNHFIQDAYPHHPIGNDSVWKHEIPCIASNYDYLLHSMLALSASDIVCTTEPSPELHSTALAHRIKAITSLNNAITVGISSYEEGNAMIATCFALLFQSCLIDDGLVEYMTFIRGTLVVAIQMGMRRMQFLFDKIFADQQLEIVEPAMRAAPLVESEKVTAACRSFEKFGHLCQTQLEIEVYTILFGIARALITSSRDAYMSLRKMYELFSYTMPHDQFKEFTNPRNEVCKLLQAHFVAMQLIMTPITKAEWASRENATSESNPSTTGRWLVALHSNIPPHMLQYYEWTMSVEREVYRGGCAHGKECIHGPGKHVHGNGESNVLSCAGMENNLDVFVGDDELFDETRV